MRIPSALVALVGAAAGVATGVTTYQSSAEVAPSPHYADSPVLAVGQPLPAAPPQVKHVKADCVAPAVLQGGECVTTVYEPAPAPAPEPKPAPAPAPAAPAAPPAPAAPAAPAPAPAPAAPAVPAAVPGQWTGSAGSVAVACTGSSISLQAASPAAGYEVETDKSGPEEVEVQFESDDAETEVEAVCGADGVAHFAQDGDGGGDDDDDEEEDD